MEPLTALELALIISLALFVLAVTAFQGGTEYFGYVFALSLCGLALVMGLLLLSAISETAGLFGTAMVLLGAGAVLLVAATRGSRPVAIAMAGIAGTFAIPGLLLIGIGSFAFSVGIICLLIASAAAAVALSVNPCGSALWVHAE